MSDRIYTNDESSANHNHVIIAEACGRGVLTKTNFANGTQKSYDLVKYFNFSEFELSDLRDLYALSIGMLTQPKRCFIRARIKDPSKARKVVRKVNGDEATLVLEKCNWFVLDIDWKDGEYTGDVLVDSQSVLLALNSDKFKGCDYFAVASASYGFKPGINMRMFFWSSRPVSGLDVKNWLGDTNGVSDPAILNPIQIIYTAAPMGIDPVAGKNRVVWKSSILRKNNGMVDVRITDDWSLRGAPEIVYNKERAILNANAHYNRIGLLDIGYRHPGLITECIPLGKLVGQGHFERDEVIDRAYEECSNWYGNRDPEKDRQTIIWAVDKGIAAMDANNNQTGEF